MNATLVYGLTSVFDNTFPVKVKCCPLSVSVFSTYMFASMFLLPVDPGPPLGVYQNELVSFTEFGASVSVGPENVATRSCVPHPLANTNPPPLDGSSNTFMNPCHGAAGSTVTVVSAPARAAHSNPQPTINASNERFMAFSPKPE